MAVRFWLGFCVLFLGFFVGGIGSGSAPAFASLAAVSGHDRPDESRWAAPADASLGSDAVETESEEIGEEDPVAGVPRWFEHRLTFVPLKAQGLQVRDGSRARRVKFLFCGLLPRAPPRV
jgi:hypothetical protein